MIIQIPQYTFGYRVVSLAKDETTCQYLLRQNLSVLSIAHQKIVIYPEEYFLGNDPLLIEKFNCCDNFDVFEIQSDGKAFLYYNNECLDNAFVLTGKCNSNCIMCPDSEKARRTASTMRVEQLRLLARHIPSDAAHITITGGEPFLLGKDIFLFFQDLKNKFLTTNFLLLTNGRIFANTKYCRLLKETLPAYTVIGIPIHGYDETTHDAITRVKGSFAQTLRGLKNLLLLEMNIELRIVVHKITTEYMDKIVELILKELPSVRNIKFMGLELLGNAALHKEEVWIPYPVAFAKIKNAIYRLIKEGKDVALYNFPLCAVDPGFWSICARSITDYKIRYDTVCEKCRTKDVCGGVFSGSFRYARKNMKPIEVDLC